jgi:hypothetical protein
MLTAVHPDGTHVVVPRIEPVEMSEYWTSPATGHRYPPGASSAPRRSTPN